MKAPKLDLGNEKDWYFADQIETPKDYPIEPNFVIHDGEIKKNDPYYDYVGQQDAKRMRNGIVLLLALVVSMTLVSALLPAPVGV